MHSSPELDALEDDLFPGDGPSTPRNAASFALASAELSPPNSQSRFHEEGSNQSALAGAATAQTTNASSRAADNKAGPVQTDAETGYQWTSAEDAPGYEWKSNRAREDEVRSWDTIVDKGSMIKTKYGDPLKPELPMGLKR